MIEYLNLAVFTIIGATMNFKCHCVGILSLLVTIQATAINNTNETTANQPSKCKSALNKVASLVVMDQKDPDGRERRHGILGAFWGSAVGHFLGEALVLTGITAVSGVAGLVASIATPGVGIATSAIVFKSLFSTVMPLSQPFIHGMSIGGGVLGGIATGPV